MEETGKKKRTLTWRRAVTKADVANLGLVVVGALLYNSGIPIVQRVGGFLFTGAFIIGMYRIYRKAKAEKKEVFF